MKIGKKIKRFSFSVLVLFSSFFWAEKVLANETPDPTTIDFNTFIETLYNYIASFTIVVAALLLVFAAYLYMTSSGDAKKISQAKGYIYDSIIALVIVMLAFVFFRIINPQ